MSSIVYTKFQFGLAELHLAARRSKTPPVPKTVLSSARTVCTPREKPICRRAWDLSQGAFLPSSLLGHCVGGN